MISLLLTVALAMNASSADEKIHPIVVQMQGTWELNLTQNGDAIRIIKQIEDQTETVSAYRNGQLVQKHKVLFRVHDEGPVTVFRWTDGKHIAGPHVGQPIADGASVIRIVEKQLICVEGLLKGDPPRFSVQKFRRPK